MGFPAKKTGVPYQNSGVLQINLWHKWRKRSFRTAELWKLQSTLTAGWSKSQIAVPPRPLLVGDWGTRNFQLNSVQNPKCRPLAGPLEFPCDTLMRPTFCLYPTWKSWNTLSTRVLITLNFSLLYGFSHYHHILRPEWSPCVIAPCHTCSRSLTPNTSQVGESEKITTDLPISPRMVAVASQVSGQHQRFSMF